MKKVSILLVAVLLIATMLCACGGNKGGNDIVGSWSVTQDGITMTMSFEKDGSGSISAADGLVSFDFTYELDGNKIILDAEEDMFDTDTLTYERNGNKLTIDDGVDVMEFTKD